MIALRPISISNLAWPKDDDAEALDLVAALGFEGVELAPGKVFSDPARTLPETIARYRTDIEARGLKVSALQSILFGVSDVALFGTSAQRERMADHLRRIADLAGDLGAGACVFGSPTLRDPGDLSPADANVQAAAFFAELAPHYAVRGVALCFEANPPVYGCRFATRTEEGLALVDAVDATGFALQLDTGTILINGEDPAIVEQAGRRIGHFHVSEPQLRPLEGDPREHGPIAAALFRTAYRGWISIEMKAAEDWRSALRSAYASVRPLYGPRP